MSSSNLDSIVDHPAAWLGPKIGKEDWWIFRLTEADVRDIRGAIASVRRRNIPLEKIAMSDFQLPVLGQRLAGLLKEIQDGRGFALIRGLGGAGLSPDDLAIAYWGIGTHLGNPATQNPKQDLLGHVRDEGRKFGTEIDARGYHSNAHLDFHVDGCEIVGLLCFQPAKSGGLSSLVSAVSVYNEMLRRYPEHLPTLRRGYSYIKREAAFTNEPVSEHRLPVFGRVGDVVSCRFVRSKIEAAATKTGVALTKEEVAALDAFESVARDPALRLDMDFQLGDIQMINNYTVLHSRTEFEDYPEPERKRHLLRLWLTFRTPRPLPADFPRHLGYQAENSEIAYLRDWRERQAAAA